MENKKRKKEIKEIQNALKELNPESIIYFMLLRELERLKQEEKKF